MSTQKPPPGTEPKQDGPTTGSANEEMVRKLLQMNPHLRGDGQSTKDVMTVLAQAKGPEQKKAPPPVNTGVLIALGQEVAKLKERLAREHSEVEREARELQQRKQTLETQRKMLPAQACAQVIAALLRIDPNLTQRRPQVLLEQQKAFLDSIGFSVAKLNAAERDQAKK